MRFLIIILVVSAVVILEMYVIAKWDAPLPMNMRQGKWIFTGVLAAGTVIRCLPEEGTIYESLLLGIFAGCMLVASITDAFLCQVHCFVWWIGWTVGIFLLILNYGQISADGEIVFVFASLLLFWILQYGVFGHTYGRADSHAFFACALVETVLGIRLEGYLLHMIMAYILLIVVQIGKKNVTGRGRLRRPVPFLPYINLSFLLTVIAFCG